jgi:hypothetical protein
MSLTRFRWSFFQKNKFYLINFALEKLYLLKKHIFADKVYTIFSKFFKAKKLKSPKNGSYI